MRRFGYLVVPWLLLLSLGDVSRVHAAEILLKDGRILSGKPGVTAGMAEKPVPPSPDGSGPLQLIVFVDDDLRRTFVPKRQIREVRQDATGQVSEKFVIPQRVSRAGRSVAAVGPPVRVTPFDEYGRRIFTMNTAQGQVDVIQGITEITPQWIKVEGLVAEGMSVVWDMRLATSSLPQETLAKILSRQIDPKNLEHRKRIAAFYLQTGRPDDAAKELGQILAEFTQDPEVQQQLDRLARLVKQVAAQKLLEELELRRGAGQHGLVLSALENFPSEGVAGENLQRVREIIGEYENWNSQRKTLVGKIDTLLEQINESSLREAVRPIRDEIERELGPNTLERMAAFNLSADDDSLTPGERVSLAASGWLLGSDNATEKLPVAISSYKTRGLIRDYLCTADKLGRAGILELLAAEEAGIPPTVSKILAHMKPPAELPEADPAQPGFYRVELPGASAGSPRSYAVQLPPEYDPARRYPAVVTLHGLGRTPEQQIDWWAGEWDDKGRRQGQATRHGYIVIAPDWAAPTQKDYRFSLREHAAVLDSLRDACQRLSIDTDRVFLSGHSMGGDAAVDIGLAHPHLWAGVIPIVARIDRYGEHYWPNAELVPFYFICGQLDGPAIVNNAMVWDRWMLRAYNLTVVEFLGRGHEAFSDEIQRLFDWMGRFKRDIRPREFTCATMRPWDNVFWWVELSQLPPKSMVDPASWPPGRGVQAVKTKASFTQGNGAYISTGAGQVTVWLSPELLNFEQPISVVVNGNRINRKQPYLEGDLETLLEDARTRADRQHPFWLKIDSATGRLAPGS